MSLFLAQRLRTAAHSIPLILALCGVAACDDDRDSEPRILLPSGVLGDNDAGSSRASTDAAVRQDARVPDQPSQMSEDDGGTSRPDGASCTLDQQCSSQHCRNDVCCQYGECCRDVTDCSAAGGVALTCEQPKACQGFRGPPACRDFRCSVPNGQGDADDSACDDRVVASECGAFAPVYCNGDAEQRMPRCPDTCNDDSDCDRSAHCDTTCLPDVPKGAACDENSDCESGQCNAGRCCVEGNCTRDLGQAPEAVQRQCLDMLAGDDCSRCGCTLCTEAMLGCYDSGNEVRDALCSTLLECAFREACFEPCVPGRDCFREQCWCGADCTTPSGSCTRPIEAAAGGANSAETLAQRANDRSRALFYAERYGECLNTMCRSECGL